MASVGPLEAWWSKMLALVETDQCCSSSSSKVTTLALVQGSAIVITSGVWTWAASAGTTTAMTATSWRQYEHSVTPLRPERRWVRRSGCERRRQHHVQRRC